MLYIKRKKIIIIISIIIIIIPTITKKDINKIIYKSISNKIEKIDHNKNEEYLLTLEIPKIDLQKKVYPLNSSLNNVDKNVEILSSSDISNNMIILASHSGTNKNAYFNDLYLLNTKDLIYIHYQNKKYVYQVSNIYYIEKTGFLEIQQSLTNTLILITCSRKYNNKQLIISSVLINKTDG